MINLLMIQPENREINNFRRLQFNNFSQITIPYLAAFVDDQYYATTLVDEYCQRIPYRNFIINLGYRLGTARTADSSVSCPRLVGVIKCPQGKALH